MNGILLVEDDQKIAKHLTVLLGAEGFSVIHAATRREAVVLAEEESFDLALADISLPDGSGFALYTAIKAAKDVPVIFLTASDDEASVVTGLNMGADDYITKPFRPRELIARIRGALRKSGQTPGTFKIGSLQVDTARGTVQRDGQEVFLSALEYRLLLVFINAPTSIITRDRLLDEVWDAAGEFVNDNTLTVYIKRLREKIEDNPRDPQIIVTLRGMGYRLGNGHASK
ncbi:response regulator transcription factor [Eubacterium barkeri]|uniref:Stage 0 sporulation protein A homolog n=1 Tax=Eubacterium barkeri TaxID=1528 RepID=A0A1H3JE85_EUBBA|nr:response regulator transcription factor [Eubacterium barkeri]SDY38330.1 DNA-binding response regulator, OmpR family, contains REC and winged-helix (wHTH) domain [Eubacterium barkeri]